MKIKGNRTKQLNGNIRFCIDVTLCDHNDSGAEIPLTTVMFVNAGHILVTSQHDAPFVDNSWVGAKPEQLFCCRSLDKVF